MTRDEFQTLAIALVGTAVGWQAKIARRLSIEPRTVRRWIENEDFPGWALEKLTALSGANEVGPWPRDEWIIGDAWSGDGHIRTYITHALEPRFIARVVNVDEDGLPTPNEGHADLLSGTVYAADQDTIFCEVVWIDEVKAGAVTMLMEAAADAIERYDNNVTFAEGR